MISSSLLLGAKMNAKKRALQIVHQLERQHPDAGIELEHSNALELLVATILSSQSTDAMTNKITHNLFAKYHQAEDYASADLTTLQRETYSSGFFRSKAKNIKAACQILVERHGSQVPKSMDELTQLPGVGRKSANIVLYGYGIVQGVAVDTHVRRLSMRLGLTRESQPGKIERELMTLLPKSKWMRLADVLIFHGRRVCLARRPRCTACSVSKLCPSAKMADPSDLRTVRP